MDALAHLEQRIRTEPERFAAEEMIQESLVAERIAIESYSELIDT